MIASSSVYLLLLALFSSLALYLAKKEFKALSYLPPIVILYMSIMILSSNGLFEKNEAISQSYSLLKSNLLPSMLFLMLLPNKTTQLLKLGPKMLLSFLLASLSLFIAFILSFILFALPYTDIEIFAPLAGSWMGGTANMLAVSSAINSSESAIGITMLIDSVDYSLWVMLLLLLVPLASKFNHFTKASNPAQDVELSYKCTLHFSYKTYAYLIASALVVSLFTQVLGIYLSKALFSSATTWSVLLATFLGIVFSFSPLAKIKGLQATANAMLYLLIALIASRAEIHFNFELLSYLFLGLFILLIHALLMFAFAKLFKLDLFSISVASLANIGGIASAPILSAAYSQSLVGIGVLMASLGYILGTFIALFLAQVLRWIV
ncbi:MAG TPA: DUF819 domain-containing protein [Sulfurimonas sp.]|nr:DUF819 domain-containing protein [Sulfurimonas sp.]